MAARAARVSDGGARPVVCERDGEGERRWERSRGFQGGCVASPRGVQASRWSGKQEVAEACAGARHRAASVRGEEDDRGVSGGGLGRQLELGQVG